MSAKNPLEANLTIPNLITLVRILLTPLFISLLLQGNYRKAFMVFILAVVTDVADGLTARVWQQKSPLGTFLDPLADKLLLSSAYLTLGVFRLIPPWLVVVVFSRDLVLALGVLLLKIFEYPVVIRPSLAGKITAALQMATVLLTLLGTLAAVPRPLFTAAFWFTGLITAGSGIHYVYFGLKLANRKEAPPRPGDTVG